MFLIRSKEDREADSSSSGRTIRPSKLYYLYIVINCKYFMSSIKLFDFYIYFQNSREKTENDGRRDEAKQVGTEYENASNARL